MSLSAITYDLNSPLLLDVNSVNMDRQRRCSRVATLDGGVSFYDTGFSAGDLDIVVQINRPISATQGTQLRYFFETQEFVIVATSEGVYIVKPEKLSFNSGQCNFNLLVSQKIS